MDNTETQATLGTTHRTKTKKAKNITQKTKKMSNKAPIRMNPGACKRYAVPVSYKTPAVILVQSSLVKVLFTTAKKISTLNAFEKLIFRNGQPVHGEDNRVFVCSDDFFAAFGSAAELCLENHCIVCKLQQYI